MESLKKHISANTKARELGTIEPASFVLKNPFSWQGDMLKLVIREYQFLKKLHKKVPEWTKKAVLGYDKKAIEQCSSSITANYKFKDISVQKSLDLTGGYGIDSYYLSRKSNKHHFCEINKDLCNVVSYNFKTLGADNITIHNISAEEFIDKTKEKFDIIYIDPDRRDGAQQRKFQLEDLRPNLLNIQSQLAAISPMLVIKLSPIIDIQVVLKSIEKIQKIQIIGVKGEVKELVLFVEPQLNKKPFIETANFNGKRWETDEIQLNLDFEKPTYSKPLKYIYEPNACLMKTMEWSYIAQHYSLKKIAPQSHYFTSDCLVYNFPGRTFQTNSVQHFKKKHFSDWSNEAYSVLSRNFGKTSEHLKKQFRIKESDLHFLIFTSDLNQSKIVIKATKHNT